MSKKRLSIISACVLSACVARAQNGEPDYAKESEFHRIYKTYNEAPTSSESWTKALGNRQSETYSIQKGDTLWDVSQTLFGDSHFWPKVWSLNKGSILNPHEINPAMAIQFFAGDMQDAPTLEVASAKDVVQTDQQTFVVENEGQKETFTIPPRRTHNPVLKKLPPSLPRSRADAVNTKTSLEIQLPKSTFPTAPEYLGYYIGDVPAEGSGFVSSTELDSKTAGDFQYVYVQMKGAPEKHYVAIRNGEEIKDPERKGRSGRLIEYQAELEVLDRVSTEKNLYRALVKKTIVPLDVGAVLIPGSLPMFDPKATPVVSGVGGKIIGGQYEQKRHQFGNAALVFIDAGSQGGLQVGQSLNIFADEKLRNKKTEANINDRVIGQLKIVKVTPEFATGYVTKATTDILPGDLVGINQVHASAAPPSSFDTGSGGSGDADLEKEFENSPETPAPPADSGSGDTDLEL